jgi:hypothetical protein
VSTATLGSPEAGQAVGRAAADVVRRDLGERANARTFGLTPTQVDSPIAGRPYDLRHAAVSLWLNAGVPATEVAESAGRGVDVLLRVYAKCVDGGEARSNARIEDALIEGGEGAP